MTAPETEKPAAKCEVGLHDRTCGREAVDGKRRCICHSQDLDKDPVEFQTEIDRMLERKDYDFTWFVFPDGFDSFDGKTLEGPVRLDGARFNGRGSFNGATFQGRASFDGAWFKGEAVFQFATFEGDASFRRVHFKGKAWFFGTTFEAGAQFFGYKGDRVFSHEEITDFRFARFLRPEKASFKHVYLGRARFLEADVRQVDFTDVEWAPRGRHRAVWDEMEPKGPAKNYALIGELYRQLKHNYEEKRDPIPAGDFHFGEMEMRRLEPCKGWLRATYRRYLSAIAFYRWISGYGEDYVRALAWIAGVILVFALAFAAIPALALQTSPSSGASHAVAGLGPHLLYSAMCFLLRGDKPLQPAYLAGHYLSVAEGVLGPPLIAMFVLALNRRFKR